jgi:pimeloyl-ACP methyl ester carboxylesterase
MSVPAPEFIATADGAMAVLRWPGPPGAPLLHFAHATGMNARLYADLLAPLAGTRTIIASDARGHGLSHLPADPAALTSWNQFADDLNGLLDAVAPGVPVLLAGHSMGATVSLLAASARPERVAGLLLLDPALLPFDIARASLAGVPLDHAMADQAARRRALFPSVAAARANWHGRGVFKSWPDAALDAYLAGGMVPDDSGEGVALACTPAFEAATFRAVSPHVEAALAGLTAPFVLLAGEHGSTVRDAELSAFASHPGCRRAGRIKGTSHFLPLEVPDQVRAALALLA